jgi:poly(A) polymerase
MTHARGQQLEDIVLMTTLFYEPMVEAMASTRDRMRAATEFLIPITERIAIPRRVMDGMRRMVALIPRLKSGRTPARAKGEMFVLAQRLVEIVSASPVAG